MNGSPANPPPQNILLIQASPVAITPHRSIDRVPATTNRMVPIPLAVPQMGMPQMGMGGMPQMGVPMGEIVMPGIGVPGMPGRPGMQPLGMPGMQMGMPPMGMMLGVFNPR